MKIQCLHCLEVFPPGPRVAFMRVHFGPGEPHWAEDGVVGAITVHARKHEAHRWLEGRDYALVEDEHPQTSFTCPRCHKTSPNPHDVEQGYCGNCHDWTGMDVQVDED